jgi:hypothetical protein
MTEFLLDSFLLQSHLSLSTPSFSFNAIFLLRRHLSLAPSSFSCNAIFLLHHNLSLARRHLSLALSS